MEGVGGRTVGVYQRCEQGPRRSVCCDRRAAERAVMHSGILQLQQVITVPDLQRVFGWMRTDFI